MALLEPLRIGSRTAPSRVVFGPHETNLGRGRALSERHVAYYRRRAAGGAGVIVVEEASVHSSDWPYERAPLATECGPGWSMIADACHTEGSLVLAALGHAGGQGTSHWSQRELWAPSRVPEVNTREVPKWMEPDDIAAVVDGFVAAARLAVASGCDGVEINAGQHSLLRQFLSGLTNQRVDEWGGDRTKLLVDVLDAVRAALPVDSIVGLRFSADELAPWAGITPETAPGLIVSVLGAAGAPLVDSVTVVRGSIYSANATRPDGHTPPGFNLDLAGTVRDAIRAAHGDRIVVVAQGSIVDPGQAEWAAGEGAKADAVEMTRALLADAELVSKLRVGTPERIRPCILCNQTCQVRDNRNPPVTCVADPLTGHETTDLSVDASTAPVGAPRRVLVVGGGVAGMEAARVAANRGHHVTLVERGDRRGGATRTAAQGAGRERLALLADWLESECDRVGVMTSTNEPDPYPLLAGQADATISDGDSSDDGTPEKRFDAVIVATGARARPVDHAMTRAAVRFTAAEVLEGAELPRGPVLVWDPIGGPIGVSVAERLATEGRQVLLATPDNIVGNELSRSGDLAPANNRLQQLGVTLLRRSIVRSVKKGTVELEDRFSGALTSVRAAAVIDAGHRLPDEMVWEQLSTLGADGPLVVRAGDCVAPRTIHEAVLEGRRAALAIEGTGEISDGVPMGELHAH